MRTDEQKSAITKKEKIIYLAKNKNNGKIYIGQTSRDLKIRIADHVKPSSSCLAFSNAIKKYGKNNFEWSVLDVCSDQKELNDKEIYYISKYNSNNKKIGYNIKSGGNHGGNLPEDIKLKISRSKGGKSIYGSDGKEKRVFETQKEAALYIGCSIQGVSSVLTGRIEHIFGWRLSTDSKYSFEDKEYKNILIGTNDGITIFEFDSMSAAARHIGCHKTAIRLVVTNKNRTANGWVFSYCKDDLILKFNNRNFDYNNREYRINLSRGLGGYKIYGINFAKNSDIIEFDYIKDCSSKVDISPTLIGKVLKGRAKCAKGWYFSKNKTDVENFILKELP